MDREKMLDELVADVSPEHREMARRITAKYLPPETEPETSMGELQGEAESHFPGDDFTARLCRHVLRSVV